MRLPPPEETAPAPARRPPKPAAVRHESPTRPPTSFSRPHPLVPRNPHFAPFEQRFSGTRLPHTGLACERVRVARVIDGDTVKLADGRKVRLIGINTPERGEALYRESTAFTRRLVEGKALDLCYDIEREDQYGRTLGYLYVDGRNVSAELVRRGLAYTYTFVPNVHFRDALLALQQQARAEGLGLWSLPAPEPAPYYVSRKGMVHFHRPSCPSARRIPPRSRIRFERREEAFDSGRCPCRRCAP